MRFHALTAQFCLAFHAAVVGITPLFIGEYVIGHGPRAMASVQSDVPDGEKPEQR